MTPRLQIGCAGWNLPKSHHHAFSAAGSHLERYAGRLFAVEINSSFYRPHNFATYRRWNASTPSNFRFSVKVPKTITHVLRLENATEAVEVFLSQISGLGPKLACLLIQLPPSLAFDEARHREFLHTLRSRYGGLLALEPRHPSWFEPAADQMLASFEYGRVLADPVLFDLGAAPGGWPGLVYLRLHGSPRRYWSSYTQPLLQQLADRLTVALREGQHCWCIFDNTAGGEAVPNALALQAFAAG